MPKVWNKRDPHTPAEAVYVGRGSPWGNPYKIGESIMLANGRLIRSMSRAQAIQLYRNRVTADGTAGHRLRAQIRAELRGKDLVCWCAPKPCHADVLLEVANSDEAEA